jgi:hypothetical protein
MIGGVGDVSRAVFREYFAAAMFAARYAADCEMLEDDREDSVGPEAVDSDLVSASPRSPLPQYDP